MVGQKCKNNITGSYLHTYRIVNDVNDRLRKRVILNLKNFN
jgi:hypothetical protein